MLTCAQTPDQVWTEQMANVPKEVRDAFAKAELSETACAKFMTKELLIENFMAQYSAGQVGKEYIGSHGHGNNLWPPLEEFDDAPR